MSEEKAVGVSVAILCGGRSARFGSDKALHEIDGKPMYRHVWDRLSGITDDIFLQVAKGESRIKGELNEDLRAERGPLGGIASALLRARHGMVFVVACDMPFVDPRIVGHLIAAGDADIVVPRWRDGKTEPTCALYSKGVAPVAGELTKDGPARISRLFTQGLKVRFVQIEPLIESERLTEDCFLNVNMPEDLERRRS